MNDKIPVRERLKKCPKCDYEWLARTIDPPKCPFCQQTLKPKTEVKA
jgi:rubrerythrin